MEPTHASRLFIVCLCVRFSYFSLSWFFCKTDFLCVWWLALFGKRRDIRLTVELFVVFAKEATEG